MTRAGRAALLTAKRVYWGCAGFLLPALNPLAAFAGGGGGVVAALVFDYVVLWFVAQYAWHVPSRRKTGLIWGMLVVVACSVVAAVVEFVVVLAIAASNCPPNAYECPI